MIRTIAKLCAITVLLSAFVDVAPVFAVTGLTVAYVSSTGSDANPCTAALPCATIGHAIGTVLQNGQIDCTDSPGMSANVATGASVTIDCPGSYSSNVPGVSPLALGGTNQVVKVRNLTISGIGGGFPAIQVIGGSGGVGTLIIENCVFENMAGIALDIEPNGALNLVIKNSRISNNAAAGVLIKPASGGSVTATFDGVTITNNAGGLKTDTTNGAVRVDVFNSNISNNANNGLVALGGAGGNNMVTAKNDVIASNGQAGIESSGGTAAVLVNNSTLDSNTGGALAIVSGGRIFTYQNNSIIGNPGSSFTGTATPQ